MKADTYTFGLIPPFFKYTANKPIVNILTVWKTFVFIAPSAPALNTPFPLFRVSTELKYEQNI